MDESLQTWLTLGLAVEVVMLALGLKGSLRVGRWFGLATAPALIALLVAGDIRYPSAQVDKAGVFFVSVAGVTLLLSITLLLKKGPPPALYWAVWFLNLALCSGVLAFVLLFRLQF